MRNDGNQPTRRAIPALVLGMLIAHSAITNLDDHVINPDASALTDGTNLPIAAAQTNSTNLPTAAAQTNSTNLLTAAAHTNSTNLLPFAPPPSPMGAGNTSDSLPKTCTEESDSDDDLTDNDNGDKNKRPNNNNTISAGPAVNAVMPLPRVQPTVPSPFTPAAAKNLPSVPQHVMAPPVKANLPATTSAGDQLCHIFSKLSINGGHRKGNQTEIKPEPMAESNLVGPVLPPDYSAAFSCPPVSASALPSGNTPASPSPPDHGDKVTVTRRGERSRTNGKAGLSPGAGPSSGATLNSGTAPSLAAAPSPAVTSSPAAAAHSGAGPSSAGAGPSSGSGPSHGAGPSSGAGPSTSNGFNPGSSLVALNEPLICQRCPLPPGAQPHFYPLGSVTVTRDGYIIVSLSSLLMGVGYEFYWYAATTTNTVQICQWLQDSAFEPGMPFSLLLSHLQSTPMVDVEAVIEQMIWRTVPCPYYGWWEGVVPSSLDVEYEEMLACGSRRGLRYLVTFMHSMATAWEEDRALMLERIAELAAERDQARANLDFFETETGTLNWELAEVLDAKHASEISLETRIASLEAQLAEVRNDLAAAQAAMQMELDEEDADEELV